MRDHEPDSIQSIPPLASPSNGVSPRETFFVVCAVFVIHAAIALMTPMPGVFIKYNVAAEQILTGQLPTERLVDFSPLYLWLSLFAERFLPTPLVVLEWLQIALAAVAAGALFMLLRRRVTRGWAIFGAAVFALDWHLLVYERILEPELVLLACVLGFLAVLEGATLSAAGWAGLLAALALATRPTFLPVFLFVPAVLFLRGERGRSWLLRSAAVVVPVLAVALGLGWRAAQISGEPGTPVMNPGTVFFEGNNPLSEGTSAIYPPLAYLLIGADDEAPDSGHAYYRTVARASTGEELSISEVNAFWAQPARRYLVEHPGHALRRWHAKLVRAFHIYRWHDISIAWEYETRLPVPSVPFALLGAGALLGMLVVVRDWRRDLLLYGLIFAQLGVMLVFYVSARQRLVMLPALIVFAILGASRLRGVGWRRGAVIMALLGLLAFSFALPNDLIGDEVYRRSGKLAMAQKLAEIRERTQEAPLAGSARLALEAMASAPWWLEQMRPAYLPQDERTLEEGVAEVLAEWDRAAAPARFDRGVVALAAGRVDEAEALLEPLAEVGFRAYRGARQASDPRFYLGRAAALRGDRARAEAWLEEALADDPGEPFVLAELVALGQDPVKTETYRRDLFAYWSELDARYLLGRAFLTHGHAEEAAAALGTVARALPGLRDARVRWAAALGEIGRFEEGTELYLEATEQRVEPLLESQRVVVLFEGWAARHSGDARVTWLAAQVLYQHGRFRIALELLEGIDAPPAMAQTVEREKARLRAAMAALARP